MAKGDKFDLSREYKAVLSKVEQAGGAGGVETSIPGEIALVACGLATVNVRVDVVGVRVDILSKSPRNISISVLGIGYRSCPIHRDASIYRATGYS